ncbi:hypothetical protein OV079_17245 [Nannocystis pusilla]|uniref:Tryptophan synthase alpha chain n=1 Tax=Nannocystis pusilla TaxID=889268 RepID=A0A9X3EQ06_9BACT|nr:hypothetical protein [Nannocystis pusilla]MCY1007269.1 hypothetical protein [Nannocystis pusilla]
MELATSGIDEPGLAGRTAPTRVAKRATPRTPSPEHPAATGATRMQFAAPAATRVARRLGLAAVLALASASACLKEYTIGRASSTDDTSHTTDDTSHASEDSDDSHESETCSEGQTGCDGGTTCLEGQEGCDGGTTCDTACEDPSCPEGLEPCGSDCVAAGNCCDGACDPVRERCDDGTCRCRDGLVRCGSVCVDTRSDPNHCGECDEDCGDQGVCNASKCLEGCGDGRTDCDGSCVVLGEDPLHCDACGSPCPGDQVCLAGDCRLYTYAGECLTCPCPSACTGDLDVCCDSAYLGAAVCVENGCG